MADKPKKPDNAGQIVGTAPYDYKDLILQSFKRHWWARAGSPLFGANLTADIDIVYVNLDDDVECTVPGRKLLRMAADLEVIEHMCDNDGNMHAGSVAFLIDGISSSLFVTMDVITVSLILSISFFAPAKKGSRIRLVNTAVVADGNVILARTQVYDIERGTLLFTGEHAKMKPSGAPLALSAPSTKSMLKTPIPKSLWKPSPRITEPDNVPGAAPSDLKARVWNLIEHWETGGPFALQIGKTVRLREVGVKAAEGRNVTYMVCELEVYEPMLNVYRNMHGGCTCYLIHRLTAILRTAISGLGPSVKLDVNFHAPAVEGKTIRIVCSAVASGKRVCTTRCEVFEAQSGRLLMSGTHTQLQPLPTSLKSKI